MTKRQWLDMWVELEVDLIILDQELREWKEELDRADVHS